ncbi:MAG TPA: GNAT family N-acetyltransferase [Gaiellaceae bacterium]|nr:GNAT family N-acetyltransferase [Gaiellaceae bacterium]
MWERLGERLEGRLVVLEPLARGHAEGLFAAARDPEIWRWTTTAGDERDGFERWLAEALEAAEAGREAPFAIVLRESGEAVGSSRYLSLRPEHHGLEIGHTWHARRVWGTGVNVEAKYLLLRHAFEELGCMRVEFKTDAENERARGALEALPARFEGVFRKHMLVWGGRVRHSAWYAVTDDEWPATKAKLERRLSRR